MILSLERTRIGAVRAHELLSTWHTPLRIALSPAEFRDAERRRAAARGKSNRGRGERPTADSIVPKTPPHRVGIRRDEETEPLLPVHSKVHHDLKSTRDGFGFTRYYAAVPGHEFVVPVRLATSQKLTEYGFYVFIDKGCDPDPKDFDHFHWWGANPSKEDRILVVNGFYKSPTESRAMRFAPTHDVDNVPISSSPSYTAACASMADPRPAPRARQEDEEERQKKRNLTGWIVLRFHKVAGY